MSKAYGADAPPSSNIRDTLESVAMIARELGMDPVAFRRKNLLRDGRPQASGTVLQGLHAEGGARLEVTRGLVEACHDLGVGAFGEDTVVVLAGSSTAIDSMPTRLQAFCFMRT